MARIRVSGQNGNWKADAWFLERSAPSRWGRTRVEVTGKDGEPLHPPGPAINVRDLDDEALAVLREGWEEKERVRKEKEALKQAKKNKAADLETGAPS